MIWDQAGQAIGGLCDHQQVFSEIAQDGNKRCVVLADQAASVVLLFWRHGGAGLSAGRDGAVGAAGPSTLPVGIGDRVGLPGAGRGVVLDGEEFAKSQCCFPSSRVFSKSKVM